MKFPVPLSLLGAMALVAGTAGCSAGSGGGGLLDYPGGTISLANATTNAAIVTSPTNPYLIPFGILRFTITATETHYDGPYSVAIISEDSLPTASNGGGVYPFEFNVPCFSATAANTFTTAAVPLTFTGSNANGQPYAYSGAVPAGDSGNPCHSGEFETATISDTKGHTLNFYYEEE
jgi:hypothetical protein